MVKILKKLYNGEYSLAKSYWFFGNVIPLALFLVILSTIFIFSENPIQKIQNFNFIPENTTSLILTIFFSLITILYIIISTIGVWRSANNHNGKKIWAILAKVLIIIACISYLNDIRKFFFS